VRYVGEPVAIVLAQDRQQAGDAFERIAVEVSALPVILDPEAAACCGSTPAASGRRFEHRPATAPFAMAIPAAAFSVRRTALRSRTRYRAMPARRSKPLS